MTDVRVFIRAIQRDSPTPGTCAEKCSTARQPKDWPPGPLKSYGGVLIGLFIMNNIGRHDPTDLVEP